MLEYGAGTWAVRDEGILQGHLVVSFLLKLVKVFHRAGDAF